MTDIIKRLWERDTSLWGDDKTQQAAIAQRLGWLDGPDFFKAHLQELTAFAKELQKQKFTQIVLLGMGGSSLCPYLFSSIFGSAPGFPHMFVLDTTDPAYIRQIQARLNIGQTMFIVSSKSGGTIEPNCLFKYFYSKVAETKKDPGQNFIAITDPGSSLLKLAQEHNFNRVFINPPDIGGRYSALSYFGLIPAAAIGINLKSLNEALLPMAESWHNETNPALELAEYMANMAAQGKNKLTVMLDDCLSPFGLWLEQLIAESTGKHGKGLIPVVGEIPDVRHEYGSDRCFVSIGLKHHEDKHRLELINKLQATNKPIKEYLLDDPYQLSGEFLRWEMATALCGHFLNINPFDEPNVTESKKNTKEILSHFVTYGEFNQTLNGKKDGWSWQYSPNLADALKSEHQNDIAAGLKQLFANIPPNGYFGLLAYLPPVLELEELSAKIRSAVRDKLGCATISGFGPRYLHSSGQQHKGGPENGVFLIITRCCDKQKDLSVPSEAFTFGELQFAQAFGDFQSLSNKGRTVIQLNLGANYKDDLNNLLHLIKQILL